MREIIFDGTCDIGGYRRSSAALGLDIGLAEDVGIRTAVGHMDIYLTRATQLVLANAFGDDEFAAEQSKALQQLANG